MGRNNRNKRSTLKRLWRIHKKKCSYCNIATCLPPKGFWGRLPPHSATIEHIYSKLDIRRLVQRSDSENVILACQACNERKSIEDQQLFNKKNMLKGDPDFRIIDFLTDKCEATISKLYLVE